jgi:hypothetical protein
MIKPICSSVREIQSSLSGLEKSGFNEYGSNVSDAIISFTTLSTPGSISQQSDLVFLLAKGRQSETVLLIVAILDQRY